MKVLIIFLFSILVLNLSATIIYIPEDQPTIQAGINVAANGDTVLVTPGVYNEYLNFEGKDITVASLFLTTGNISHISQTILNDVVTFESGESSSAILEGFTLETSSGFGAIQCRNNSNPTLRYLNISRCVSNFLGCGIHCENSSPHIVNCTIANNDLLEPNSHGGAIYARNNSHPILINSIVWNNYIPQISLWNPSGYQPSSITIAYCDIDGGEQDIEIDDGTVNWLQGNIDIDPLFEDPPNGDFTLHTESPCIDSGTAFFVLGNDTLVNLDSTQYVGPAPDMGAFEYDPDAGINGNVLFPTVFLLHQNYPNPFNPTTTISFSILEESKIELSIYNINGQKIKSLLNDQIVAGEHSIVWTGVDFTGKKVSSGIYFYKLITPSATHTKKMLLLK